LFEKLLSKYVFLGIFGLILCGIISAYTGTILGKCWLIIKERYQEYDDMHVSDPFPVIGFRAAGKWGEMITRVFVWFSLFGAGKNHGKLRTIFTAFYLKYLKALC